MSLTHEELRDLVAAYAVDALEGDEVAVVEDHLRDCPRCRSELTGYQETVALLAFGGGDAPDGVWDRIAADTAGRAEPPALSVVLGERPARVTARRWALRVAGAAAAAVVAVLGLNVARDNHRLGQVNAALSSQRVLEQATAAALDPDARRVALTSADGRVEVGVAILPGGRAYVVPAGLRALPSSRTYQLWSIVGGRPVSAGLLGATPTVASFVVPAGTRELAITDEPAGGSRQPTGSPVASASV